MKTEALHVFVNGMVQGVGFRQAAAHEARKLGLTGWVRNLSDGRVEAWFEGPDEALEAMLDWCRKGPGLAEVLDVEHTRQTATESHPGFNIRF